MTAPEQPEGGRPEVTDEMRRSAGEDKNVQDAAARVHYGSAPPEQPGSRGAGVDYWIDELERHGEWREAVRVLRLGLAGLVAPQPAELRRALWHVIADWSGHDEASDGELGCPCVERDADSEECNCGYSAALQEVHRLWPVAPQPGDRRTAEELTDDEYNAAIDAAYEAIEARGKGVGTPEDAIVLAQGFFSDGLIAALAALRGASPTPEVERLTGETGAVLMAQEQWEATDDCEKFDRVCPPIVYGIARAAYRMGRATSDTPEAGYCTCSGFWKHDPDCPELSAVPPTGERPTQAEIEADAEEFRPSRDVSGRTTRSVLKKRSGERPTEEARDQHECPHCFVNGAVNCPEHRSGERPTKEGT